jgi:hypothetical protein
MAKCPICKSRLDVVKGRWPFNQLGIVIPHFVCPACNFTKTLSTVKKEGRIKPPSEPISKKGAIFFFMAAIYLMISGTSGTFSASGREIIGFFIVITIIWNYKKIMRLVKLNKPSGKGFNLSKFITFAITFALGILLASKLMDYINFKDNFFMLLFFGFTIETVSKIVQKIQYNKNFIVNQAFLFYILIQSASFFVARWIVLNWVMVKFPLENDYIIFGVIGLIMSSLIHLVWKTEFCKKKSIIHILILLAIVYAITKGIVI